MRSLLILFLSASCIIAQHRRDSWKLKLLDLDSLLTHSLVTAPFANSEREQIYRAIEEQVHDSFTDADRDEERQAVMGFLVGSVAFSTDRSEEILVRGTNYFCGATGNCSMWILVRQGAEFRVVLDGGGNRLTMNRTSSHGLHDVSTGWHYSAFVEEYHDYRFDGLTYKQVDCYSTEYPITELSFKRPTIVGCR
jgi:hypothetical protein